MQIRPAAIESNPFPLRPGVVVDGKLLTDCVVRVLTRGEEKEIAQEPEEERGGLELCRSIVRLGNITDQAIISEAFDFLVGTDIFRIQQAISNLQAECFTDQSIDEPATIRTLRTTDIKGAAFRLNPGLVIDGRNVNSCVVRILRRGEDKLLEKEPDPTKRDDLFLYLCVVQFGDCVNITPEMIDMLTADDCNRISDAYKELRAIYSPSDKSEE